MRVLGFELNFNNWLYYLAWTIALVGYVVAWLILRGRTGRSLRAVRDSETAAVSSGVNLTRAKAFAFGVSAAYAGAAGALFAIATTYVNPDTYPVALSIFLLVGVVVAGLGSLTGLIVGAIFIQFMPLWAQNISKSPGAPAVIYGAFLILLVLALPGGAAGPVCPHLAAFPARARLSEALTPAGYHRATAGAGRIIAQETPHPMHRKLTLILLVLAGSLTVGVGAALAGTTGGKDDPGVTPKSILLGGTAPLTGPRLLLRIDLAGRRGVLQVRERPRAASTAARSPTRSLDDGYNAAQTVPLTRQLVEQDKVFAIFNPLGTESNLAVRPYLNQSKVPQLFVGSGATTFGRDYAQYPDTIGFQPTYQAEGWVYGKYLAHMAPGSTIAVLFQKDEYGKDLLGGLKRGLQRSKAKVIAAQPYDPLTSADVSAQMAKLKASGADTLAIFATSAFAAQAYAAAAKLGWKPKHVINNSVGADAATMSAPPTAAATSSSPARSRSPT